MILDSKHQQSILLGLIQNSTIGGAGIDQMFALKQAIVGAKFAETEKQAEPDLHDRNCLSRAGGACSCPSKAAA